MGPWRAPHLKHISIYIIIDQEYPYYNGLGWTMRNRNLRQNQWHTLCVNVMAYPQSLKRISHIL